MFRGRNALKTVPSGDADTARWIFEPGESGTVARANGCNQHKEITTHWIRSITDVNDIGIFFIRFALFAYQAFSSSQLAEKVELGYL